MRLALCATAAAILAVSSPLMAQEQKTAPDVSTMSAAERFQTYVTSDNYKQMIGQLAGMGESISAPECKDARPTQRADLSLFQAPNFGPGEHPMGGLWRDRIQMSRCGATSYQNILVQGHPNGEAPRAALMMPGLTAANPPMQSLIMKDVLGLLEKKKCTDQTDIIPTDSKMEKEITPRKVDERGLLVAGAWRESWSFRACGKKVSASVEFQADSKGGLNHKVKM